MWRKCDLHIHTGLDDLTKPRIDVKELIARSAQTGLDVISLTDHDDVSAVAEAIRLGSEASVSVLPGVEITTDAGHILCYAPGVQGLGALQSLLSRVGARPGVETSFDELTTVVSEGTMSTGDAYSSSVIIIGAHVDQSGSLLASEAAGTHASRMERVRRLHAIEVVDHDTRERWLKNGIKGTSIKMPILRSSDAHELSRIGARHTWLYLPALDRESLIQGLTTPNSSIRTGPNRPSNADQFIKSLSISDGLHANLELKFGERINAIIGPPSIGKSLIVDALRFLFCDECDIAEVRALSRSRMEKHLPQGTVISAEVVKAGESLTIEREVGATTKPELPFKPIIFSQTELTRRAMEQTPSISLIDVHIGDLDELYDDYVAVVSAIEERILALTTLALSAASLRSIIENPVDGLKAVNTRLTELGGGETLARRSQVIEATLNWRRTVQAQVRTVESPRLKIDALPSSPNYDDDTASNLPKWAPQGKINAEVDRVKREIKASVGSLAPAVEQILGDDSPLREERERLDEQLAEIIQTDADDVLSRLRSLREQKVKLDAQQAELSAIIDEIETGLSALAEQLEDLADKSNAISSARREACRRINQSLSAFFCRAVDDNVDSLAKAVKSLRTGLRRGTIDEYCRSLNRLGLIRGVVNAVASGRHDADDVDGLDAEQRVAAYIVKQQNWHCLSQLAVIRREERLYVGRRGDKSPMEFHEMTEGLRALAIKEISFISSVRPVISDQPEDSVPTRSVYDELVPTFRDQRRERQFILVSHDANIVVGADADNVIVVSSNPKEIVSGTLFVPQVSKEALNHLEGGEEAFARRQDRYAVLANA